MKKKVISVILAAAMLCAMLTVFASASQDATRFCPLCDRPMYYTSKYVYGDPYYVSSCGTIGVRHKHSNDIVYYGYCCESSFCYFYDNLDTTSVSHLNDHCCGV